jgi:hypothetical protein
LPRLFLILLPHDSVTRLVAVILVVKLLLLLMLGIPIA